MTGHLNVPALEPDRTPRRRFLRAVLTDLLRNQLGFQGLVSPMRWTWAGSPCAMRRATRRSRISGRSGRSADAGAGCAYEALLAAVQSGQIFAAAAGRISAEDSGSEGAARAAEDGWWTWRR